jgi:hypothetical protein
VISGAAGQKDIANVGLLGHELIRTAGHTVLLLAGPDADRAAVRALHAAIGQLTAGSEVFEAFVALDTGMAAGEGAVCRDADAAAALGVSGLTLLAIRPDGHVGLRADRDHLTALKRYKHLI